MSNAVLFLDCDGVINGNSTQRSRRVGGFEHALCDRLGFVLRALPELKLVISSAWRYQILNGQMNHAGFEIMLISHGIPAGGRIVGHTVADEVLGADRRDQIEQWVEEFQPYAWLVVDDLPLGLGDRQVQTDGNYGLTAEDTREICKRLIKQGVNRAKPIR